MNFLAVAINCLTGKVAYGAGAEYVVTVGQRLHVEDIALGGIIQVAQVLVGISFILVFYIFVNLVPLVVAFLTVFHLQTCKLSVVQVVAAGCQGQVGAGIDVQHVVRQRQIHSGTSRYERCANIDCVGDLVMDAGIVLLCG